MEAPCMQNTFQLKPGALFHFSLSQLNLNSPRKPSKFCCEAQTTKEGEGGRLVEQFSYPF